MKDFIEWKDFTFTYDVQSEPTLKNIDLTIAKGEKVLLLGPSGSGKSTLGNCLNGIIPATHQGHYQGRFTINQQEAFGLSIYDKSHLVSTVLQDPDGQFIGLSVAEDIAFALENDGLSKAAMQEVVTAWAARLEILPLLEKRPQDLSGGQKQRVTLAGVLVDDSPILLFDEPLANLDPQSGQEIMALIDRIHHEQAATTLIIEHRLEDVLQCEVDRIVLINDGQIVYNGKPDGLLQSNLLEENGIQEPLYLSALKQMGYPLKRQASGLQLSQLDLTDLHLPELTPLPNFAPKPPVLTVTGLSVSYHQAKVSPAQQQKVLDELSVTLGRGEMVALVGQNGAGKSTLAKALCQFVENTGHLLYQGQDISKDTIKERAERIGYVLQNPNQMISQAMLFDEVALGLRLRGLDPAEIKQRVHRILRICGLYPFRKWPISALSFGQKKRVTIASILVLNPAIIILDEPTAGQDKKHYLEMMSFVEELKQKGHTIVMITHDMQLMLEHCDRALVLHQGRIVADDAPISILSRPELLEQAHLKKTSLFDLAERLGQSPQALTQWYIQQQGGPSHG